LADNPQVPVGAVEFKQAANYRQVLIVAVAGASLAILLLYTAVPVVVVACAVASVYFISRPYELLLWMVFLIPFNFVFRIGPIPVAAELLKVVAWVPFLLAVLDGRVSFIASRYNKWFAILGAILLLSVVRAQNLSFALKEVVRFGSNIALCYLVINLVNTREKLFQVFRVLTVSTAIVACYGFYQFAIKDFGALFWIVNPRLSTDLAPGREAFWEWRDRITSVLTSEMELGHYFNLVLPVAVVLWIFEGRKRISSKWLVMTVMILAGLVLTFTFGAWASLVAAIGCFVFVLERKLRWKMVLVSVLVLSLVAALVIFSPLASFVIAKAAGVGVGSFAWDLFTRLDAWIFAAQTWWAHPVLGVGVGNYQIYEFTNETVHSDWVPIGSTPHQTYLYILAEAGIIGFISIVAVLLATIRANLRIRNHPEYGLVAFALALALTANLIGWFADDSTFFGPHASYLVWLLVGLCEAVQRLASIKVEPSTPVSAAA
jgi:putative inorganic carbon (HCO3(-)) transporter